MITDLALCTFKLIMVPTLLQMYVCLWFMEAIDHIVPMVQGDYGSSRAICAIIVMVIGRYIFTIANLFLV
jgi:hypothetical protein